MSLEGDVPATSVALCRNCGTRVDPTGGKFCPRCGWTKTATDDPLSEGASTEVSCPACWAPNPSTNRHCEQCAARLGHSEFRSPVSRGRDPVRLGVAAVAVVLMLLVAFVVVANGASESDAVPPIESAEPDPTTPPTVPLGPIEANAPVAPPGPLTPDAIEASSELSPDFAPGLMLDGDLATAWNDASRHGDGATLTFRFSAPTTFDRLILTNLNDPDRFIRNYRLREYTISIDGGPPAIVGALQDTSAPQTIELGGAQGSVVTLSVVSTFAAEATDSGPGFEELAIAEVEFIGSVSGGS